MAAKSAAVLALDVSCSTAATLEKAIQVCVQTALDKILYAPNDELGLVLTGTTHTANPLNSDGTETGGRYKHITVAQEVGKVGNGFLESLLSIDSSKPQKGKCDILETLAVCAHQLHMRTAKKKYSRRIYLITEAKDEVKDKTAITAQLEYLKENGVSVAVVGMDFTQDGADVEGSWEGLDTKAENERVLHHICDTLNDVDGASAVISVEESLEGLQELRRRKVLQRGLAKLVLTIGDVKIATQLYSKVVASKIPPLKKVTSEGAEVGQHVDYVRVGDVGGAQQRIGADGLVRALRYGRSLIPCSDADVEAMKIKGPRGLEALGFVPQRSIPAYTLTEAAKTLLPLAGDLDGQRGFRCLVEAMLRQRMALIVRYVSRTDAKPALGVCHPAFKESSGQYVLYYAALPFSEDVRLYRFSEYPDVTCTAAEEALVESLVHDMTVDRHALRPSGTFNPEVHQFYATVRAKVIKAAQDRLAAAQQRGDGGGGGSAKAGGRKGPAAEGADGVPELIPPLRRTSAAFASKGNALEPLLHSVLPKLESLTTAFPYVEVHPDGDDGGLIGGQRRAWFNSSAAAAGGAAVSDGAPTTVAAPALVGGRFSVAKGGGPSEALSGVSTTAAAAMGLSSGAVRHVSSIDPVSTFRAVVQASQHDPAARAVAMDELVEVLLDFLRHSIKDDLYSKCDDCVRVLREHCVAEEEPTYFHVFLRKLQATAQELELGEAYWTAHIVRGGSDVHPITREECKSSPITNKQAAREFMLQDRTLPPADLKDDSEEDFMDLIV